MPPSRLWNRTGSGPRARRRGGLAQWGARRHGRRPLLAVGARPRAACCLRCHRCRRMRLRSMAPCIRSRRMRRPRSRRRRRRRKRRRCPRTRHTRRSAASFCRAPHPSSQARGRAPKRARRASGHARLGHKHNAEHILSPEHHWPSNTVRRALWPLRQYWQTKTVQNCRVASIALLSCQPARVARAGAELIPRPPRRAASPRAARWPSSPMRRASRATVSLAAHCRRTSHGRPWARAACRGAG